MSNKINLIIVVLIWFFLLSIGVITYRYFFVPKQQELAIKVELEKKKELVNITSSNNRHKNEITLNLDSFSGYSVVRSDKFKDSLASYDIGLRLVDDNADYTKRINDLKDGNSQFAVFTIDALIKACEKINDIPAVIIFVIDESRGADAAIGVEYMIDNIDTLNDPLTKFVVVPDSPSETLSRVIMSYFNLDKLEQNPFTFVNSSKELYNLYRKNNPSDKNVFVTWEPLVSKISSNPDYKVLVDSSKFRGYFYDVMVVNRDFLVQNPVIVKQFTESYFGAYFNYQKDMKNLILSDSIKIGEPLKDEEAIKLVDNKDKLGKIWFKNTRENYGHFGVVKGTGLQHIDDAIVNILNVLKKTNGITVDPTNGNPNVLYFDKILELMLKEDFFPGKFDQINQEETKELTEEEWDKLIPVGTLKVPDLVFGRGTSNLTESSKFILDELVKRLSNTPQFYLTIKGNSSNLGDVEANKALALSRANVTKDYLISVGLHKSRIRVTQGLAKETTVNFIVNEIHY